MRGCQSSAFRQNSTFFFIVSAFLKTIFGFLLKNRPKKFFFRLSTPPPSTFRRASVNSRWHLDLPVRASSVSGLRLSSKAPHLHSAVEIWCTQSCCVLAYSVGCLDKEGGGGGECLLVGCLTSQQHASVSRGRICTDNFTCCHTETEVADQTFHLTQSQYTDTGPTSPNADPITPGAWQGSHWSANV